MNEETLKAIKTCDLVNELKTREGVACEKIEPHTEASISVYGPAVVLVIFNIFV